MAIADVQEYTHLTDDEVEQIGRFEQEFLSEVRAGGADILAAISADGELSEDNDKKLAAMLDDFTKKFA